MIFDGVNGQSRGGKPFIPEVIEHLEFDTQGYIIDGELMLPGNVPLQTTMTAIKKYCDLSPTLIYCVYDIVDEDLTFEERIKILTKLVKNAPDNVFLVETTLVENESQMEKYHQRFVLDGYEGTILRNAKSKYTVNQRSENLQKHKDFMDGEFKIVGVKEGDGLYKGCAIFKCVTKEGEEFDSNPEGTLEYKRELFMNKKDYIGKWLTVRYFEKTLKGKPTFNVGVSIREDGEF
jgi:DNA ligase-1